MFYTLITFRIVADSLDHVRAVRGVWLFRCRLLSEGVLACRVMAQRPVLRQVVQSRTFQSGSSGLKGLVVSVRLSPQECNHACVCVCCLCINTYMVKVCSFTCLYVRMYVCVCIYVYHTYRSHPTYHMQKFGYLVIIIVYLRIIYLLNNTT